MSDGIRQVGKFLKNVNKKATYSLKRPNLPQFSQERIRDVFDTDHPMFVEVHVNKNTTQVLTDFNFGQKLPILECCGDCFCGQTEAFNSDQIVSNAVYTSIPYVPLSTVVYLDGLQGTLGVDYFESSPTTGGITVVNPVTSIIVSYVYTVGNCQEAICVDERFECLDYTFLSGLVTVFSDRFDRSEGGIPSGGCGRYVTSTGTPAAPLIGDGEAAFSSEWARVGGANNLIGKSVEMLVAINTDNMGAAPTGDANFTFHNAGVGSNAYSTFFRFIKTSSTTMELRIQGLIRQYLFEDDVFSNIDITSFTFNAPLVSTSIAFTGGRYWFRMAQMEGFAVMKAWPQNTPEPAGAQLTISLADSYAQFPEEINEIYREWVTPTVQEIGMDAGGVEALMVGAGLDNGAWGINAEGHGIRGTYCAAFPTGEPATWNRFQFCTVESNTTVNNNDNIPKLVWGASWPLILGDVPPPGQGKLIDYEQSLAGISLSDGHPSGVRIKGQLVADVWDNTSANTVTVQIKTFSDTTLTMMGANGLSNGSVVTSYTLPTDGTPVDVDFLLPGEDGSGFVRWGLHVPGLENYIAAQPTYFGAFLSPNNVTNRVQFYYMHGEGVQSVECTAGPFCQDCSSTRCPELVDNFDLSTATADFGTTDFLRTPTQGAPFIVDKGTGSKVEFISGVQKVTFTGSTQKSVNVDYKSPIDCHYTDQEGGIWEAYFEVKITEPASGTGTFAFGNIDIDYTSGGGIFPSSFGVTPTFNSTALTAGTWWSVRNKIEGTDFLVKIWAAGTSEPSTWTFSGTITDFPEPYALSSFLSSVGTGFITETRAVHITKVV